MALLVERIETLESSTGTTFRLADIDPGDGIATRFESDIGTVIADMGLTVTGKPGEPGLVPSFEPRHGFGIFVPTAIADQVRAALVEAGYQVIAG